MSVAYPWVMLSVFDKLCSL